jgi:hypothetical protein
MKKLGGGILFLAAILFIARQLDLDLGQVDLASVPNGSPNAPPLKVLSSSLKVHSLSDYYIWPDSAARFYRYVQFRDFDPDEYFLLSRGVVVLEDFGQPDANAVGRHYCISSRQRTNQTLTSLSCLPPSVNPWNLAFSLTGNNRWPTGRVRVKRGLSILTIGLRAGANDEIRNDSFTLDQNHLELTISVHSNVKKTNNTFPYYPLVEVSHFTLRPGEYQLGVTWHNITLLNNKRIDADPLSPIRLSCNFAVIED